MTQKRSIVRQLAAFVHALNFDDVPEAVIIESKRCLLDTVGVIVAGQSSPVATGARAHALASYGAGAAHLIGLDVSLQAMGAALVNGTAAHANDFDDTSYTGIMHGSAVVLPAALAIAEQQAANGTELLEAFIAGVEIEYAIAELCTEHIYFKGWWTTGIYGTFGAAAASAKILALNVEQIENAIAMAAVVTTGMKAAFGTDAKPLGVGMAASRGLECALLAARNLNGPENAFEDDRGLLRLLNDNQHQKNYELNLKQRWRLIDPGILFKSFPVCSAAQAGAELTRKLLKKHQLDNREIERVVCEVPKLVEISLVYHQPLTIRQAQFSMPFAIACMLIFGELRLEHLSEQVLSDPRIQMQMKKVSMSVPDYLLNDDTVAQRCPEGAGIALYTSSGAVYSDFLDRPTGMPGNPISTAALVEKFGYCLNHERESPQSVTIAENFLAIECCTNLSGLVESLAIN